MYFDKNKFKEMGECTLKEKYLLQEYEQIFK